jgi:hypothetical protein
VRLTALYLTSIICGFCLMALEILGGRLLFPSFGSSIDVWAAIISVFILSLSVGYVIGGRIADRARTNRALGWTIVAAAACYLLLPTYALRGCDAIFEVAPGRGGMLAAGLVLFLVPSFLLGSISPMLVKLVFTSADRVGRTTGTLYAVGSVGNVLGVLITDYLLLERVPLNANLQAMGAVLGVVGIAHLLVRVEAGAATAPAAAPETAR